MKSKQQKQQEARERQAAHDNFTYGEKLDKIIKRPGKSTKETKRLYAEEVLKNGGRNDTANTI